VLPSGAQQRQASPPKSSGSFRFSEPHTHDNLTVFLVHNPDLCSGRTVLTLQEALRQGEVRVYETENMNQLAVENLSDQEVFIQAGEVVRGGKQDRVLGADLIVEPGSGKVGIGAFCVEESRWTPRAGEPAHTFASSENMVPSNAMKVAIINDRDQDGVWTGVTTEQERLGSSLQAAVRDATSESSLELSLEHANVQKRAAVYVGKLSGAIDGKGDAIGLVVAINGRLHSAEVYASPDLFRKLWPKLLKAAAIEAIAARTEEKASDPLTAAHARGFLAAAADSSATSQPVSPRVRLITRETSKYLMFEWVDQRNASWIHRSYIVK
jgi:hypothetical protein